MSRGIEKRKQSKDFRETRAPVWKVTEQRTNMSVLEAGSPTALNAEKNDSRNPR